ncbi:T9SS type A sorting domain-containing protein [Ferruginibacter lapsinanis]|uniref:T9SS type A sorting domain-containing protein n=1 Tax=Ferruginibacter lapsinanis TaxID=563172 RepID=UPI001E4A4A0F|nr:T9SS type A sorting domain-containing protein [Ferruginibacter lapsinanis]UEG49106.1 T9SS type A sorting domain-containing protein [Ferruginibacter lapsinanis]
MKTFIHSTFMLIFLALALFPCKAQNNDLPNPNKNIKVMPAGSFIIPMDKTYQANPGYFNLKAYGLLVNLQNGGIRLRWIIDSGKVKDGVDFSVLAERVAPSFVIAGSVAKDFKAGPFVIFPPDTALARVFINVFNNSMSASNKVNVYRTINPVNVNVRYDLFGVKPKAAILDDGGNGKLQLAYMVTASIPSTNYAVLDSAVNLYNGCYTFASEPHNDGTNGYPIGRIVDSLTDFVQRGGNFLAQCHAVDTYEDSRQVQSSGGITKNTIGIPDNAVNYANPDLSYAQFDGIFIPNQTGYLQTWQRLPGSNAINNFYPIIVGNTPATDSIFGATVTKHKTGKGGLIFYLGNHTFSGTKDEDINGQRMYLNAFMTPAAYGNCPLYPCVGEECGPLPVKLEFFNVKKLSNQQAQLNWSTSTELNSKEFVIERSLDGVSFTDMARVPAKGISAATTTYSYKDITPVKGYNYYRLREVSTDNRTNNSEIVAVYFTEKNTGLDVFPTPARQSITIEILNVPDNNQTISIYSLTGKVIVSNIKVVTNSTTFDVSNFSPGTYIIKTVDRNGKVLQSKFTVIKK